MSISYVSAATEFGDSITSMPSHAEGDLITIIALGSLIPTVPAGWDTAETAANYAVASKKATSSSEESGTWTNAFILMCHVYRGADGIGDVTNQRGVSGELTYPALTLQRSDNTSWAMRAGYADGFGAAPAVATPSGFTSRTDELNPDNYTYRSSDTNGTTSSVTASAHSIGVTTQWETVSVEILDVPAAAVATVDALFWSFP